MRRGDSAPASHSRAEVGAGVLLARGRERLERVAAELGAEFEQCDVSDREQVEKIARWVARRIPPSTCAGEQRRRSGAARLPRAPTGADRGGHADQLPRQRLVRSRLRRCSRGGALGCRQHRLGRGNDRVRSLGGAYSASKHAQLAFSRRIGVELAPRGIRVHTINPGPVPTVSFPQGRLLRHPLARHWVATADDIAAATIRAVERGRGDHPPPFPARRLRRAKPRARDDGPPRAGAAAARRAFDPMLTGS